MANQITGITIDCHDPARLALFWSALLDIPVTKEHGDDDGWATVGSRLDGPRLTFQRVPEPKVTKVRIHLDIQVDDIDAGVRQVDQLGGLWTVSVTITTKGLCLACTTRRGMSSASSSTTDIMWP